MGESVLPDAYRFEDTGVSQLLDDFVLVEEARAPRVVRLYASHKLRRAGHHLLQQVHQGVPEVRRHRLLGSRLRRQTPTGITFLRQGGGQWKKSLEADAGGYALLCLSGPTAISSSRSPAEPNTDYRSW